MEGGRIKMNNSLEIFKLSNQVIVFFLIKSQYEIYLF